MSRENVFPLTVMRNISAPWLSQSPLSQDEGLLKELERNAYRVIGLIRRGIKFTPTQPDALRIEKLMLAELEE